MLANLATSRGEAEALHEPASPRRGRGWPRPGGEADVGGGRVRGLPAVPLGYLLVHPAFSIIVFTTLSGLGYGLAAVLGLGVLDPAAIATKAAYVVALALIGTGLLSSTLHLGNPQRAWRALSQWRSSWLSREGVMAIITFVPLLWSAWAHRHGVALSARAGPHRHGLRRHHGLLHRHDLRVAEVDSTPGIRR